MIVNDHPWKLFFFRGTEMKLNHTTDPVRFLGELTSDMNALFDTFVGENGGQKSAGFSPPIDIVESESGFTILMDVPGVAPEDIDIHLEENGLVIAGKRPQAELDVSSHQRRRERFAGDFRRVVRVPERVDREKITADYRHGVLTVTVPKEAKPQPTKIVVRTDAAS